MDDENHRFCVELDVKVGGIATSGKHCSLYPVFFHIFLKKFLREPNPLFWDFRIQDFQGLFKEWLIDWVRLNVPPNTL